MLLAKGLVGPAAQPAFRVAVAVDDDCGTRVAFFEDGFEAFGLGVDVCCWGGELGFEGRVVEAEEEGGGVV